MKYIKLCKHSKIPIKNEKYTKGTNNINDINTNIYNVGLLAGASNLLILDIDVKDNGMEEWIEYVNVYGEPKTVCQRSANGGLHYLFNYKSLNYSEEDIESIDALKNKSKYRKGKGIDIRKDNGYIVCEPSEIDGKKYKFISHYNHFPILNIPSSLLTWLLEFETKNKNQNDVKLIINIGQLQTLIKLFDNDKDWFKVTTCIKNLIHEHNKLEVKEVLEVWDTWSKGCKKYNKVNNKKIWESLMSTLNFNFLINVYNTNYDEKLIC